MRYSDDFRSKLTDLKYEVETKIARYLRTNASELKGFKTNALGPYVTLTLKTGLIEVENFHGGTENLVEIASIDEMIEILDDIETFLNIE